jgi:hypothetical protein
MEKTTDSPIVETHAAAQAPAVAPQDARKQKLQGLSTSIVFFNTW